MNGEGTVFDPQGNTPDVKINENRPTYVSSHYTMGKRDAIVDEVDYYTPGK